VKQSKTTISGSLDASDGVFEITGDFEIDDSSLPGSYSSATFDQIVFVDGDLTISTDVETNSNSTALFIVNGNIFIDYQVVSIEAALFAENRFETAYNQPTEPEEPPPGGGQGQGNINNLVLNGLFRADQFVFQRSLEEEYNLTYPTTEFIYEAKYLVNLRTFFGESKVIWKEVK